MANTISLQNALKLKDPVFIDMRSPAEFARGRILGAINIPLLEDREREEVGTTYHHQGPDRAKEIGLSIVSSKLPQLVSRIRTQSQNDRPIVVYCWRGGMRSKTVVTVLELMGISAFQLIGGYKIYRQYLLETLANYTIKPEIIVLCGSTGVGKTTILSLLAKQNIPVIDLERLANHRGSAFGQVGRGESQTAQNFDAFLLAELERLNNEPYIIVECESKRIGNVYLPDTLFAAMKRGRRILARASVETRVTRLIDEYMDFYQERSADILLSLESLQKKLGPAKVRWLSEQFREGRIREFVQCLLVDYYDPLYGYEKAAPDSFDFVVDADNLTDATAQIIDYLNR